MSAADPIAEAEVLLAYGRTARAVELLEAASLREPDRTDIKLRLEGLIAGRQRPSSFSQDKHSGVPIAVHACVAWVLFAGSMAGAGYLMFRLVVPFAENRGSLGSSGLSLFAIFAGIALFAVLTVVVGLALFSLLWFAYLTRATNVDTIQKVEDKLQGVIALRRMEPIYGWVKRGVYGLPCQ